MSSTQDLNVSLESRLLETLRLIRDALPGDLSAELSPYLVSRKRSKEAKDMTTIPYDLLYKVSLWSRTGDGTTALQNHSPPLDPASYSMISLLAGTRTSPEKKFPAYAPKDPLAERQRKIDDRKAISIVVNGFVSVIGIGIATWWASERTGLQLEWRTLLSVLVAIMVAVAEVGLYMIWESRRTPKLDTPRSAAVKSTTANSDVTEIGIKSIQLMPEASDVASEGPRLRQRTVNPPETQ